MKLIIEISEPIYNMIKQETEHNPDNLTFFGRKIANAQVLKCDDTICPLCNRKIEDKR